MNKMIKAFTGCLLALAIFTSCERRTVADAQRGGLKRDDRKGP